MVLTSRKQAHCYRITVAPSLAPLRQNMGLPEEVQFVSHHDDLPLPSPRYLEIHAACCRIAHLSGAAEYIDNLLRAVEELDVLAEDGGSADVLAYAFRTQRAR